MKSVTPNRVLPEWAIIELGQVAEEYGLKITVRQAGSNERLLQHDWPQLKIVVKCGKRGFHFLVSMRDDWDDLRHLGEGDLWDIVEQRHLESIHA